MTTVPPIPPATKKKVAENKIYLVHKDGESNGWPGGK